MFLCEATETEECCVVEGSVVVCDINADMLAEGRRQLDLSIPGRVQVGMLCSVHLDAGSEDKIHLGLMMRVIRVLPG